jgi:CheY-like chemotaxis protein
MSSVPGIVIAEDDQFNRMFLVEVLEGGAWQLFEAKDGKEAVQLVSAKSGVVLVIMDVNMPVMGGKEALTQIRKTHPDLPVIALTGQSSQRELQELRESGFIACLTKPIEPKDLLKHIEHLLNQ